MLDRSRLLLRRADQSCAQTMVVDEINAALHGLSHYAVVIFLVQFGLSALLMFAQLPAAQSLSSIALALAFPLLYQRFSAIYAA